MNNKQAAITLAMIMFVTLFLFWIPLLIIWSMNSLFMLNIPYTWKTWLSVYVLWAVFSATVNKESSDKLAKDFWR